MGAFGLVYDGSATAPGYCWRRPPGIILSGGPNSVLEEGTPRGSRPFRAGCSRFRDLLKPTAHGQDFGGQLHRAATKREYGKAVIQVVDKESVLFKGMDLNRPSG